MLYRTSHESLQIPAVKHRFLQSSSCRTLHAKGGVRIYLHTSLNFVNIDLKKHCKDKDFEARAIKLKVLIAFV
jgi:hypothetical protein